MERGRAARVTFVRSSSRLEGYSDAIFAIAATIMILPIAHTEIPKYEPLTHSIWKLLAPKLVVYMFAFLVVCNTWAGHVWLFETIENVDEVLVMLNLGLMLLTTFLPFSFTLLGIYYKNTLAIVLFCVLLILVGFVQFWCIMHAYRRPQLLESEVRESTTLKSQRNHMCVSALTPLVFGILAACISPFSPIAADVILLLVVFSNGLRHLAIRAYVKIAARCGCGEPTESTPSRPQDQVDPVVRHRIQGKTFSKERVECFSDGVFSIVATLIILDICEGDVPTKEDVEELGSLGAALTEDGTVFLAYAGTFITVGLQWYVHHSMLHHLKDFNRPMAIFNQLALLCIGVTPLMYSVTTRYKKNEFAAEDNESVAIQMSTTALFLVGFFQAGIWITALFSQDSLMLPDGRYGGKDHAYVTIKLAVYPLLSIIIYCLSFASYTVQTDAFNAMQIAAVGIFLMLIMTSSCIEKYGAKGRSLEALTSEEMSQQSTEEEPPKTYGSIDGRT